MISVRRTLVTSMLLVVLAVTLVLATATYFSVRHEMDELYDENMRQLAEVLVRMDAASLESAVNPITDKSKLSGEEEFLIQIWRGSALKYSSHPDLTFAKQQDQGFGTVDFGGKRVRYFRQDHGDDTVQIAQDLRARHGVIGEIYNVLLVPIIIQMPVLAILIWLLIGRGMRPLERVSNLIAKRSAWFLEPIPDKDVPVEVRTFVDALNGLLERLRKALLVQKSFTADAAHELRTPLAAVVLQLGIARRAKSEQERNDAFKTLEAGVSRCTRLVNQLLELARNEPESAALPHGAVSLSGVVEETATQAFPLSRNKSIALTSAVDGELVVSGNATQLGVMISNLVSNAILYTPPSGNVKIWGRRDGDFAVLDISDDGIGIPLADRERVFDRFFRIAGTDAVGSGLGLSIVKSIATSHGITVQILQGLNDRGTTFRLTIPLKS
jgi:two-component system OmpR family sensor kinase